MALSEQTDDKLPETPDDMRRIMLTLNERVTNNPDAGMATAVVGRIMENKKGYKQLLWASMGDARIYQVRKGALRQITEDEGVGNIITNGLGKAGAVCNQAGIIQLNRNDSLLFCSDGVTGDTDEQAIPIEEIGKIVGGAETAADAARAMVNQAKKIDDRTAVVLRV